MPNADGELANRSCWGAEISADGSSITFDSHATNLADTLGSWTDVNRVFVVSNPLCARTLTGGEGNDTYRISTSSDVILEDAGQGIDRVDTSVSYELPDNVEQLTLLAARATTPR